MNIDQGKTTAIVVKSGRDACGVSVKGEKIEKVKVVKYV